MERNALLQADYLDILFDRRNKIYGGYELRKHYPQRVKKAMMGVLVAVCLASAYTVFANRERPHSIVPPLAKPVVLQTIEPEIPQPKKQELPDLPPPQTEAATSSFSRPEIVQDQDVDRKEQLASVDDLKDTQIGLENKDGNPTDTDLGIVTTHGTPGGKGVETDATAASSAPLKWVEQMPQFDGDLQAYLANNIHYPEMAREAGIEGRVALQFVVNEQGDISDVRVLKSIGGGCDQEAVRVVKSMPRWKPGKNNGTPVKVLFTLPVTFTLN
jgi:protein TonB